MEVYFQTKKLKKLCSETEAMQKHFGKQKAGKLAQRMMELSAAETLADVSRVPPPRCHELHENRKGQFAVYLDHPYRLVFIPADDPVPLLEDGGVDLNEVRIIKIITIEDYH